jgi:hypothetical protein
MLIVEHGVDLMAGKKLAADLAIFHAQDDSDLFGLQGDRGLLVPREMLGLKPSNMKIAVQFL